MNSLIVVSALAGALAFVVPSLFWWLALFYLVPLFIAVQRQDLNLRQRLLWGVLHNGLVLHGVAVMLHGRAEGIYKYAAYILLVLYCAAASSCWLWLSARISSVTSKAVGWIVITAGYFVFIERWILIVLSRPEGLMLLHPLVPLAQYPWVLGAVPLLGVSLATLVLVAFQYGIAALVWFRKGMAAGVLIIGVVFALYLGPRLQSVQEPPALLKNIGYVHPVAGDHDDPVGVAQETMVRVNDVIKRRPAATLVLMPESTAKFSLSEYSDAANVIKRELPEGVTLAFGAHRTEGEARYNSLHCARNSLITFCYDKIKLAPFGEYVPYPWSNIPWLAKLFLKRRGFDPGRKACRPVPLTPQFSCIPLICYDVYFLYDDPCSLVDHQIPVLALTNDSWFDDAPYIQGLLWFIARLQAIAWRRPVIYVAHTGGWWIAPSGTAYRLADQNETACRATVTVQG